MIFDKKNVIALIQFQVIFFALPLFFISNPAKRTKKNNWNRYIIGTKE